MNWIFRIFFEHAYTCGYNAALKKYKIINWYKRGKKLISKDKSKQLTIWK